MNRLISGRPNIRRFFSIIVLTLAISFSCNKSDDLDCQSAAQVVAAAASQYAASPTVVNCQAYKSAIAKYLGSPCGSTLSAADKQTLLNIANNLIC
jgi:hypothetical protein